MKLSGKIRDLKRLLEKASAKKLFEPIALKILDERIVARMVYEDGQAGAFLTFDALDIEKDEHDDGEMTMMLKGSDLLKQLKVIPPKHEFEARIEGGSLIVESPRETIYFHLNENWESTERYFEKMPLKIKDGRIYQVGEKTQKLLKTKAIISAKDFAEVIKREKLNKAKYVTFREKEGRLVTEIGDIDSTKYHPRTYRMNAEIEEGQGENCAVTLALGLEEISSVLEGNVELHFSSDFPVVIYDTDDETEDGIGEYSSLYLICPVLDKR